MFNASHLSYCLAGGLCIIVCAVNTETMNPAAANDHIHQGQDKLENETRLIVESVSRGVWHCVAQYFQNAAKRNDRFPGRPIPRSVG
jgi:succinate dehydrogenase/fumarate reductase-like Fe-S protein